MTVLIAYKSHADRYQEPLVLFANTNPTTGERRGGSRASPRGLPRPCTRGPDAPRPPPPSPLRPQGCLGWALGTESFRVFRKGGDRAPTCPPAVPAFVARPRTGQSARAPCAQPTSSPRATGSGNTHSPAQRRETQAARRNATRKPW